MVCRNRLIMLTLMRLLGAVISPKDGITEWVVLNRRAGIGDDLPVTRDHTAWINDVFGARKPMS